MLNHRLITWASQLLFGNVLNEDRGIFLTVAERLLAESKPLFDQVMSQMLEMPLVFLKLLLHRFFTPHLSKTITNQYRIPSSIPMSWCIVVQGRHLRVCILHGVVQLEFFRDMRPETKQGKEISCWCCPPRSYEILRQILTHHNPYETWNAPQLRF